MTWQTPSPESPPSPSTSGLSKMSKEQKMNFIAQNYLPGPAATKALKQFWHPDPGQQKIFDQFSENTLSNFYLPFGICPHLLLDGKNYCVPMATEESSVVAAACKAAKFWFHRGGLSAQVVSTKKIGQVHLFYPGDSTALATLFRDIRPQLIASIGPMAANMRQRGGGLLDLQWRDQFQHRGECARGHFQIWCEFETCDAMGANFINSALEMIGQRFIALARQKWGERARDLHMVMAILSNYTPDCRAIVEVECPVAKLDTGQFGVHTSMAAQEFADKFQRAINISKWDVHRATTHNKGIFNGVDAVVLATGNDTRAVEACGHTFATRHGHYQGLTDCYMKAGIFHFQLELPLALGTVGGLTALHPLAKFSLELLGHPSAVQLMKIAAGVGLMQNFAAISSLITSGIQKGHMKMHLINMLNHLAATEEERELAQAHFANEVVSFDKVRRFLGKLRTWH